MDDTPRVARLSIAPVKALGVQDAEAVQVDRDGVDEDRRGFLVDERGAVVTLRRLPQLGGVEPRLDLTAGRIAVRFPDGTCVDQDLAPTGPVLSVSLYDKERQGRVVPGAVADALSAFAEQPLRLVWADRTGVGWDEGPVSILGSASAAAVGTPDDGNASPTRRYRMLLELETTSPYVEDSWVGRSVRIGTAVLAVSSSLVRCAVVDHHPTTGAKDWAGLHALARVRGKDQLTLGVIADVVTPGTVRVGDRAEVP